MEGLVLALAAVLAVAVAAVWVALAGLRRWLDSRLGRADAELRRLGDAGVWRERGAEEMRREISAFRGTLEELRVREAERRAREEEGWAVLHRLAAVLGGEQRTGRAGENVLRESLSQLPPSMVVTDFRVNGRVVEFGLVLPDGRRLPIDSKWPAERELVGLARAQDPQERDRLVRAIERTVADRAREVASYRDPTVTAPVGIAAVPDAAYQVLRRAHADAYRQGVIVIPYSMALPVALFLHALVSRFGAAGDVEACLADLARALDLMEATLENKLSRASTMLVNGVEELRGHLGKARAGLARGGDRTPGPRPPPGPGVGPSPEEPDRDALPGGGHPDDPAPGSGGHGRPPGGHAARPSPGGRGSPPGGHDPGAGEPARPQDAPGSSEVVGVPL